MTPCPLCGSSDSAPVCETGGAAILTCRSCGNARTVPSPPAVDYEADDFHARNIDDSARIHSIADLPPIWRRCLEMQGALLQRHLPAGASVLEIGCGQGLMLRHLAGLGFRVTGIEPSRSAAARARENGLDVLTGYFPDKALPRDFDAVLLSHVLEHIADPKAFLAEIVARNPRALILLVQTHYHGAIPRVLGAKWYAWVPEQHFWHFTPAGLETLAHPLGLRTVGLEFSSLLHHGRLERVLLALARFHPRWHDQFHLLLAP